jgi:membrane-associated phospholipid phosphatase
MSENTTTENKPLLYTRFISKLSVKRLVLATLFFWIPVIVAISLAEEITEGEPIPGDSAALLWLHQFQTPQLDSVAIFLTNTAGPLQMVIVSAILVGALYFLKRWRAATFLLFALGGSSAINFLLKLIFARDRPDLWATVVMEASYSFPSGHSMGSSAFAFSIIALLWNTKWRTPALFIGIIYVVLIGLTRVYLGVHYPSDVIAGWCISLAWVVTVKLVLDHYGNIYKTARAALSPQK